MQLKDKIALITGASRGIGKAVALAFTQEGAHVIALARTQGALEALDDEIRAAGGTATLLAMDLGKLEEIDKLGPTIAERFGRLDILVGNAGVLGTLGPVAHGNTKEWQKIFDVNVLANFRLIRTLDPLLRASRAGRVIFTGSGTAYRPKSYWGMYRASKAALHMLAQTYAAECEKTNIKVNVVDPGAVETEMLKEAYPGGYQGVDKKQPGDIAQIYLDLAAENCSKNGEIVIA